MRKLLLALSFFALTAWGIPETHNLANEVTLAMGDAAGDFCSATVVDNKKNLAVSANHCAERVAHQGSFIDWTGDERVTVWKKLYYPVHVTNMKMKEDGTTYAVSVCDAYILGVDELHDISILKIEDRCIYNKAVKLSDKIVKFGDTVFTMGNPFMVYNAVSKGYVTQPKAFHENIGNAKFPVIMMQVQMAPGSSGGALVNENGELIGVTNWGSGTLAFASPVVYVKSLLEKLNVV